MTMAPPLPAIDPDSEPFWEGTRRGVLLIQRCDRCGRHQFPPRALCIRCGGAVGWVAASGRAEVYSFTVVHRAPEAFQDQVPYVVALVDLEEGVRLMTRLEVAPAEARIGVAVQVGFQTVSDEVTLPVFRTAG